MTVYGRVRSLAVARRTRFNLDKTKNIRVPADQIEFPRDNAASENYAPPSRRTASAAESMRILLPAFPCAGATAADLLAAAVRQPNPGSEYSCG
jgi:pyoverdine/dityrosine biosynthesis protein Dit1